MKKKFLKSAALALAMTMAMTTVVSAAGVAGTTVADKTITTTSTLVSPVYSILLPSTLALVTNPLGLSGNDSLYTVPVTVANKSTAAVMITAKVYAATTTGTLKPYGEVNSFNNSITDKDFSLILKPIVATGATTSATPLTATSTPTLASITVPTYAISTNAWQLPSDGSGVTEGNYAAVGTGTAVTVDTANVQFLLKAAAATTVPLSAANIGAQGAGFVLSGELNPFATWAANDIKAGIVFSITPTPATVATALDEVRNTDLKADALNVIEIKHAASALAGATAITKIPTVTTATKTVTTDTAWAAAIDIDLNKVEGIWTVDATDITILNTATGENTYAFASATDVTFTATSGSTAAKLTIAAEKLYKFDTPDYTGAIGLVGEADSAGTYKLSIPMANAEGVLTTVFVTIVLAAS